MQPRNPYEADNQPRPLDDGRGTVNENLIRENERLRYEQGRTSAAVRNSRLTRENERLRDEQAYRDSAGAVSGLVIGVLVFALAVLGLGALYYLGRDTGADETVPTQPQQSLPERDININVPQPPPIETPAQPQVPNVEVPDVNVQVSPPASGEATSPVLPPVDPNAGTPQTQGSSADPSAAPSTAPGGTP